MKKETKHITFCKSITYTSCGIEAKFYIDDDSLYITNKDKQRISIDGDHIDFLIRVIEEVQGERRNW
jgi:hypothetical protein